MVRTMVWQTAWCTAIPVEPEAYPASTAPRASASVSGGSRGTPEAISSAARSAASSAIGLASGVYSASSAWARAFIAVAARRGGGAEAISSGSATTSAGRTSLAPSTPAGVR